MSSAKWQEAVRRISADSASAIPCSSRLRGANAVRRRRSKKLSLAPEALERRLVLSSATQAVFAQNVSGATAGSALPAIMVDVENASNAIVASDVSSVTITLNHGVFSNGMNAATVSAIGGVATFSGLTINGAGVYALTATDGTLASAISNTFGIYLFDGIASFTPDANGSNPYSNVVFDSSGDLFGTTSSGGANGDGTVFEIPAGGASIATLASFDGANGSDPRGGVTLDSSGDLFGTTQLGGANNVGSVFEIVHGSDTIATLASFNTANGADPYAGVTLDSNNDLFGAAPNGGANSLGVVFEIAHGSTTILPLASFNGSGASGNGANPNGGVTLDSSNDLFGTAQAGGANNDGTVFEIVNGSGAITALASFNGTNGKSPDGGVALDASNDVFGTANLGGASSEGTVFELAHGSGTITALASFTGLNGANPYGAVALDSNNDVFGATYQGGANSDGAVFEYVHGATAVTAISSFNGTNGANPQGGVTRNASGNLYGAAYGGGASGIGAVFELIDNSGVYTNTTLASFSSSFGANPYSSLTFDSNGNLFGTTSNQGADGDGTVFEIVRGSNLAVTVASFNGTDGENPVAGLTMDSSGDLFGTTSGGGASQVGTVFEIAQGSGAITTLANFNGAGNGAYPEAGVTLDSKGDIFGTTAYGGSTDTGGFPGDGIVFEIQNLGGGNFASITTIGTFDNGNNGANPLSNLALDSNGDLFGTTSAGGPNNDGTVFEVVRSYQGVYSLTPYASFSSATGAYPYAGVTLDSNNDIFGTTTAATGSQGDGTVFEILDNTSTIKTLATFTGVNGENPLAGVTLDSNGDLFGTTSAGSVAADADGTVFELAKGSTTIATLASFTGPNGNSPQAGVTLDSSGDIFGTTPNGGANSYGVVFELTPAPLVLSFSSPPVSTAAGNKLDPGLGVQVSVAYSWGNPALADASTITLSPSSGAFAAGSTAAVADSNAVATFTNVILDSSGTYTLTASDGSDSPAISGSFTVSAAAASKLAFLQQPTGASAGAPISPAVTVAIEDQYNNAVTSNTSTVALTLNGGSFAAGTVSSAAAVNGVATFSGLMINALATGYTITATGLYASAVSNPFAVVAPVASVAGLVFNDVNDNAVQDKGEGGLAGVTVTLTPTVGSPVNITTAANGTYSFANVSPGNYTVTETLLSGYALTAPVGGSASVAVVAGQAAAGPTFGQTLISSITLGFNVLSAMAQDYNNPGTFANGDLNGDGMVNYSDLILLAQNYNQKLPSGVYASVVAPANVATFAAVASTADFATAVAMASPAPVAIAAPRATIAVAAAGSISGTVFDDTNGDGKMQSTEPGIAGRSVYLDIAGAGTKGQRVALTNSYGNFVFSALAPGNYVLRIVTPSGWRLTAPGASTVPVILSSGGKIGGELFGQTQDVYISGTVFADANGDGIRQSSELGLAGWTVQLLSTGGSVLYATTTNASGNYSFISAPPGSYELTVVPQAGYVQTAPAAGDFVLRLPAGKAVGNENFGENAIVSPFTISSTRVVDPSDPSEDIVTFYALNNGVGAWAGTKDLIGEDATLASPGGLQIRTYDADGTGVADDADFAGENVTSTASYIRIGGPSFYVASTTPAANTDAYVDLQSVTGFEVAGTLFDGGVIADTGAGARIAVAVVPHGDPVALSGELAAEQGPAAAFSYADK